MTELVLASTSPYRRTLLDKLGLGFLTVAPDVDEAIAPGETPHSLVSRLAEAKARQVGAQFADALVVGSDQVACIDGEILGKPGNRDNAIAQLNRASGRAVEFHTGLCLLNTRSGTTQIDVECFTVRFRTLTGGQVARYIDREQPFNCAGSFKSEGYGITLFEGLDGRDPNTLIGLPLIRLVEMLGQEGIELP